jgi:hypothetical protein
MLGHHSCCLPADTPSLVSVGHTLERKNCNAFSLRPGLDHQVIIASSNCKHAAETRDFCENPQPIPAAAIMLPVGEAHAVATRLGCHDHIHVRIALRRARLMDSFPTANHDATVPAFGLILKVVPQP